MTLNEMAKCMHENAQKRHNNGANISVETRRMLKHTATEVVEATEAYTELTIVREANKDTEICTYNDEKQFESEIADIIACCLIIAAEEDIDIEKALNDCYEKNRKRAAGCGDKI